MSSATIRHSRRFGEKMSFVYFHTVVILTVFSELCRVSSPDTLASHREQALWICGFYFFASRTGAKLWNIAVVLTLSFASDVIATGNWEQSLLTPRNGMLLCALLCSMVDVLTNVGHDCKAEHCKQYLLYMFTSICLPILWSIRATLPQSAIPVIICLLCFSFFVKTSLHANKNLCELGEMAVYILYVFSLVCASKGPVAMEGVIHCACLICLYFSTNKHKWENMAICLFHGFLWTHVAINVLPYFNGYVGTRNLWIVGFLVLANTRGIDAMNVAMVWGLIVVTNIYHSSSSAQLSFEPSNWWISLAFLFSLIHAYQNRVIDQADEVDEANGHQNRVVEQTDEVDEAYWYEFLPV